MSAVADMGFAPRKHKDVLFTWNSRAKLTFVCRSLSGSHRPLRGSKPSHSLQRREKTISTVDFVICLGLELNSFHLQIPFQVAKKMSEVPRAPLLSSHFSLSRPLRSAWLDPCPFLPAFPNLFPLTRPCTKLETNSEPAFLTLLP